MSATAPTVFLVLEDGIDARPIEDALPAATRIQPVSLNADRRPLALEGVANAALVIVGCVHEPSRAAAATSQSAFESARTAEALEMTSIAIQAAHST